MDKNLFKEVFIFNKGEQGEINDTLGGQQAVAAVLAFLESLRESKGEEYARLVNITNSFGSLVHLFTPALDKEQMELFIKVMSEMLEIASDIGNFSSFEIVDDAKKMDDIVKKAFCTARKGVN